MFPSDIEGTHFMETGVAINVRTVFFNQCDSVETDKARVICLFFYFVVYNVFYVFCLVS